MFHLFDFCLVALLFGAIIVVAWAMKRYVSLSDANMDSLKKQAAAEEKLSQIQKTEQTLAAAQERVLLLSQENERLRTMIEQKTLYYEEKDAFYKESDEKLKETFKALSSEALSANNSSFLKLAEAALSKFQEHAKGDLGQRQKAISELLAPIKEALSGVDKKVHELEKVRVGAYETLKLQVKDLIHSQKELKSETTNLVQALRAPNVRGRWGEMQLKRVVEMAGMLSHCDFTEQVSSDVDAQRYRPDMIVHLPGEKNIVVDAKAPLHAYLEALEAKTEHEKQSKMKLHAKQVRQHIIKLSSKGYWDSFKPTPEFVVLFLPGETFFSAALEQDPSLIELGAEHKVILSTPTTLIALLRSVSYGWRQEVLAKNAKAISDLGQEMHKRIYDMNEHFSRVGKNLSATVEAYNQTLGTLERRVLVSARKFEQLEAAKPSTKIEQKEPIEKLTKKLSSLTQT